jgi:hypothetical protein|tara:strand:+ start:780 stop:1073 length:294 start_codon:yes stop_codon:yes gene_type:complete
MKERHKDIPKRAQFLKGIGACSWFEIIKEKEVYRIIRFAEDGIIECNSLFIIIGEDEFAIDERFEFSYISHCDKCTIIQNNKKIIFKRLKIDCMTIL